MYKVRDRAHGYWKWDMDELKYMKVSVYREVDYWLAVLWYCLVYFALLFVSILLFGFSFIRLPWNEEIVLSVATLSSLSSSLSFTFGLFFRS